MDIFESLENLNVSEECFDEILNKIEESLKYGNYKHGIPANAVQRELRADYTPDKANEIDKRKLEFAKEYDNSKEYTPYEKRIIQKSKDRNKKKANKATVAKVK